MKKEGGDKRLRGVGKEEMYQNKQEKERVSGAERKKRKRERQKKRIGRKKREGRKERGGRNEGEGWRRANLKTHSLFLFFFLWD